MSLSALSVGALEQLAHALRTGQIDLAAIAELAPSGPHGDGVEAIGLNRLASLGLSNAQATAVIQLLIEERTGNSGARHAVVWSGPEGAVAETRDTSIVVRELFASAKERVLVSTYAVHQAEAVFAELASRMDALPSLSTRLFLNVARPYGNSESTEALLSTFAGQFRQAWPGRRLPEVFYDPRSLASGHGARAVLHAKCVVVDGRRSFVTSANFTEAAQERNFELGLLVDDGPLAKSIEGQFETLIEKELVLALLP